MSKTYTFRKRTFLNPETTNTTSHVLAFVESSRNGENKWGGNWLILADCHRSVQFEFCLGNKEHRRLSLKKINRMIETLSGFRDALTTESKLIEKRK